MESGSFYVLYLYEDNSNIGYIDVKLIEYIEVLFLKLFVGYNVMFIV